MGECDARRRLASATSAHAILAGSDYPGPRYTRDASFWADGSCLEALESHFVTSTKRRQPNRLAKNQFVRAMGFENRRPRSVPPHETSPP